MVSNLSEDKVNLRYHLHWVEDHLHGITAMIERGADCQSILQQIAVVQTALQQATGLLAKHHVRTCLKACLQHPDANVRDQCLADVIFLYQLRGGVLPPVIERNSCYDDSSKITQFTH